MKKLFFTILCFIVLKTAFSQGCSDAGFCTMGAMKPNQAFHKKLNIRLRSVEISQYLGTVKFGDYIWSTTLDLTFGISDKTNLQIKLPYTAVQGVLANTQGLGDISLSLSRNLFSSEKFQINATIGAKIPTNKADKSTSDGLPLPMYYQTSLGSYDIVAGISLISKKWLFAAGYQQALNQAENNFTWGAWKNGEINPISQLYPVNLKAFRGIDVMTRVERNFRFAKFFFNIGALYIHRLTNDTFISPQSKERIEKTDTHGASFTLLTSFGYSFSVKSAIKLSAGKQLFNYKTNIDGLSREEVIIFGFEQKF
ncbi:MAG: hypothetical protein EAZ97_11935 [Bacteroidetes bacterium]|nr:MAG: hypothetical protein EAZ97_11935 [Bacteroidota bacterium]